MTVELAEIPQLSATEKAEADRIAKRIADAYGAIMREEQAHTKPVNVASLIDAQARTLGGLIAGAPVHLRGALVAMVMQVIARAAGAHAIVAEIGSQPPPKGH